MKNKSKKTLIIIFSAIVLVVVLFFGTMFYITSTRYNYSFAEKKWINDNTNNSIDIIVDNTLPIFSNNGEGVFYDYLSALEDDTGLKFNVLFEESDTYKFSNKNSLGNDELVFYKDHFIVISKNNDVIVGLNNLENKKVGVLESDINEVTYYFTDFPQVQFETIENISDVEFAINNGDVDIAIVPMYKYIDRIINNGYNIVFHLDGLYSYYTLKLNSKYEYLDGIMEKLFKRWEEKLSEEIHSTFLNIYYDAEEYTELEKDAITSDDLIVGFVPNIPYEGYINNRFTGLTHTYLEKFANLTGATYKYIEYESIDKLKEGLSGNKIDLALNYYSITNMNYTSSSSLGTTDFVVLAHIDSSIVVNSLYSLNDSEVTMLKHMNLTTNMKNRNMFAVKEIENMETLFDEVDESSIIITEKEVFDYYKNSKLKDYNIRYSDTIVSENAFLLKVNDDSFNKLFNFYLSTLSYKEVKIESIEGIITTLSNNVIIAFILNNIIIISILLLIIIFIIFRYLRRIKISKKIKREDRMLYLDVMTNLKNRNYLNDNIEYWEANKIYPQTVLFIDLIKVKELNDKFGHSEGDTQIKAAANALIKTQRENSEIIRTNGNEFMVYLVGYDEKQITSYIHKLTRELKNTLPYKDYGVAIGYSMILDELKSIDDAINESLMAVSESKRSAKKE